VLLVAFKAAHHPSVIITTNLLLLLHTYCFFRRVIPVVLLIQVKVCSLLYVPSITPNLSMGSYHRIVYISEYMKNQLHVSAFIRGHLQVVHFNSW
jgi:hypothetical protein